MRSWPDGHHIAKNMFAIAFCIVLALPLAYGQNQSWMDYGGGTDSSHYTRSKQITKANVGQLEVAWAYPHGETGFNPIVVGNVMYTVARNSSLVALDATTGKEIWVHEGLSGITSRGMNYWESKDRKDRRLIFAVNSYLQEIDAVTGLTVMSFGQKGVVNLREGLERDVSSMGRVQSRSPGKVFENLVILGSAPGEEYVSPPGDLRAYDVISGKLVWQFHTVPYPGEPHYDTFPKDAWKYIGGNNTWGDLTIDAKNGIAFFPLGSPTYDFYGADRKGAGLYGDCLLALDARTGKYLWHFQTVHHDLWDYDLTSAPQLTTIKRDGKEVEVVAEAGKTGFLFVFERKTGKPIWPIEERKAPKSDVPGEEAWPTQPYPTAPPPFARQSFTVDDINPYLPEEQRALIKDQLLSWRNEGLFTPPTLRGTVQMPGDQGGSNWGTTAANPTNGIVYVLSTDAPAVIQLEKSAPGIPAPNAAFGSQGRGGGGGRGPMQAFAGRALYVQNCQACHGADLKGATGPTLIDIAVKVGADAIRANIQGGKGAMPSIAGLTPSDMDSIMAFLANPAAATAGRGRGGPGGMQGDTASLGGPVVASGPAPASMTGGGGRGGRGVGDANGAPEAPSASEGASAVKLTKSGGNVQHAYGGNGGSAAYPEGLEVPDVRYNSAWAVSYNAIKPPWSTITAYDLNKGTIKWQVPAGDDLAMAAQGVHDTGSRQLRTGIIATATGLVFQVGGDRKVRAYDEETGKVLWTKEIGGSSRGVPAMYEVNGRQYLVISVAAGGGRGVGAAAAAPDSGNLPTGYVAFALPQAEASPTGKVR
uniref:Pyrrolo-quinoline quinone n=1 Tax=Solibacter usitatus (strain Ellin6076) TaxID=234267 RepID=Q01RN3_SOLUE